MVGSIPDPDQQKYLRGKMLNFNLDEVKYPILLAIRRNDSFSWSLVLLFPFSHAFADYFEETINTCLVRTLDSKIKLILWFIRTSTIFSSTGICWSMCLTYVVAEVTNCKQADVDFRGHEEIFSESGGVMDYEEDRGRPKRRRQPIG